MKKILVFIKNNENELLLLRGSEHDPQFHESFWYTVTGSEEDVDKSLTDTVKREVKEETNLDVKNVCYLNWILKYNSLGQDCEEYVFICDLEREFTIVLNEENIEYKWCGLYDFVYTIKWHGDKAVLKKVLELALKNKPFFDEEKITNM